MNAMNGEGTMEVKKPVEVLRDQDGTFKVTSPRMRVREISNSENAPLFEVAHHDRFDGSGYEPTARRWQIEKIA
jgi:hypothetical protein